MERFLAWMKGIVLLFFVFTALLYFVPRNVYKKYIRFFMEMTLILAMIYPLLQAVFKENALEKLLDYDEFWEEMDQIELDAEAFEEEQNNYYREECEKNIEEELKLLAGEHGYEVKESEVELNSAYEIESIKVVLRNLSLEQKDEIPLMEQEIEKSYQVDENRLNLTVE